MALELLSTEETYVYRLQTLMDVWGTLSEPLITGSGYIVTDGWCRCLFQVYIAPLETALEKKETWVSRSDVDTIFR